MSAPNDSVVPSSALDDHLGDRLPPCARHQPGCARVGEERHVRMLECGPHAEHIRVRLPVHRAREPVAVHATDARAVRHVRLVQPDATGRMERREAGCLEVVRELLDPRLVRDSRMRIGHARERLRRVLAVRAVHLVQLLGARVERLELVVGDRPRRRNAVVVADLTEVLGTEPVEGCAVELGRAADEVVDLRLERCPAAVVPRVLRHVAVVDEHVLRKPVRRLARQPIATLEEQDPLARRSKLARQRAAARARPDDDDVVGFHGHCCAASISGTMIRPAASRRARCENACGKLPRCLPVSTSNSSA